MSSLAVNASIREDVQRIPIAEDSKLYKAVSCVPVLGIVVSEIQQFFLRVKIERAFNQGQSARVIELLEIKNDYKTADIARRMINVALMIAGLANILTPLAIGLVLGVAL